MMRVGCCESEHGTGASSTLGFAHVAAGLLALPFEDAFLVGLGATCASCRLLLLLLVIAIIQHIRSGHHDEQLLQCLRVLAFDDQTRYAIIPCWETRFK